MGYRKIFLGGILFFLMMVSLSFSEDFSLPFFMAKISSEENELSKAEKSELLDQIDEVLRKAQMIHLKLIRAIQLGELDFRYQEGRYWMSKLEKDLLSIEMGLQQFKLLRGNQTNLVATVKLFKSLKDLSTNFNAYNNFPPFSASVGDMAPELELWADPVFYKFYLLPLALLKNIEPEPPPKESPLKESPPKESPPKEKKPTPKGKKP